MSLGAHFLLLTFFDNINFWITLFSKMMPNFWQLAIRPNLKINESSLGMLIFRQKYFLFCIPRLKTLQPVLP